VKALLGGREIVAAERAQLRPALAVDADTVDAGRVLIVVRRDLKPAKIRACIEASAAAHSPGSHCATEAARL